MMSISQISNPYLRRAALVVALPVVVVLSVPLACASAIFRLIDDLSLCFARAWRGPR
jgi:hypothetical protein